MLRFALTVFMLLPALLLTGNGTAADMDSVRFRESEWDAQLLYYLQKGPRHLDRNLHVELPDYPANSSEETARELRLLREYSQTRRDDATVERIHIEARHGDFAEIYLDNGPFTRELRTAARYTVTFANKEIFYFILREKKRFSRPRPSALDPGLVLVVPNPGHPAYPSGHATQAMLFSRIMALVDPDNASIYIRYAEDIAQRREIAGVHYPSDSRAGQLLADALLDALLTVPEFSEALNSAQESFRTDKKVSMNHN